MPSSPRVSVVVPNYNHARFLAARLDSILSQTFQDFELLLLDDASTDGSVELLKQYAGRPQTRLLLNERNSGSPFAQWNRGVQEAQAEYVWIAESDDVARPELLESLVGVLDGHSEVGVAQCDSLRIDAGGNVLGPMRRDAFEDVASRWSRDFLADGRSEIRKFLYLDNTIQSASAVVFRRQVYLDAGLADPRLQIAGDWMQWAAMLLRSDSYFLSRPLNLTRIHAGTRRQATASDGRRELEALAVQRAIRSQLPIDRATVRRGAQRYARFWLQLVRSGRYNGHVGRHLVCLGRLLRLNLPTAFWFALRLPYCLAVWVLKRTLFRHRLEAID